MTIIGRIMRREDEAGASPRWWSRRALTSGEHRVLDSLAQAWSRFASLPDEHHADGDEFRDLIQRAQLLIMTRPSRRDRNHDSSPQGEQR